MNEKTVNGNVVISNMIWRMLERIGAQGVGMIVSIILSRLIDPECFGIVALVAVFSNILQVFVDAGFSRVLMQKKDADDLDFSTVFWFNLSMCIILYLVVFFAAPAIAHFYEMEELISVTRVACLTLIISGLKAVQTSYLSRNLQFRKFFFATLIGTIVAAIVGIIMALNGFGVWALVAQNLINNLIDTIVLWFVAKWHPKFSFSINRLKEMFPFGSKLFLTDLFARVYTQLRQLIIGKVYSSEDLSFYNKGRNYPSNISSMIVSSVNSVLLPALATKQDDIAAVKRAARKSIKLCFYIVAPMMVGIGTCAKSLVIVLLTEKWLPCVFYMRFACYIYLFECITLVHLNVTRAMGKGRELLVVDVIKKCVTITVMLLTIFHSLELMMWTSVFTAVFAYWISAYPNKKIIEYTFAEQIYDLLPIALLNFIMGAIVLSVQLLRLTAFATLLLQIIIGIIVYTSGSLLLKIDSFLFVVDYIKSKIAVLVRKKK